MKTVLGGVRLGWMPSAWLRWRSTRWRKIKQKRKKLPPLTFTGGADEPTWMSLNAVVRRPPRSIHRRRLERQRFYERANTRTCPPFIFRKLQPEADTKAISELYENNILLKLDVTHLARNSHLSPTFPILCFNLSCDKLYPHGSLKTRTLSLFTQKMTEGLWSGFEQILREDCTDKTLKISEHRLKMSGKEV